MSTISTILATLRSAASAVGSAIWAITVRDKIAEALDEAADAIEQCYSDVDSASLREDAFAAALQEAIDAGTLPIPGTVIGDNSLSGSKIQDGTLPLSKLAEEVQISVDTALSSNSTNPVQNKVVKAAIDEVNASLDTKSATSDLKSVITIPSYTWTEKKLLNADGTTRDVSTVPGYKVSGFIEIPDDAVYVSCVATNMVSCSGARVAFYSSASEDDFISSILSSVVTPFTERIPSNATHMRLGSNANSNGQYTELDSEVVFNTDRPLTIALDTLPAKHLVDGYAIDITYVDGQYIYKDGTDRTIAVAGYKASDYMAIPDGAMYIVCPATNHIALGISLRVAFYTGTTQSTYISGLIAEAEPYYIRIPSDAKYVRFGGNANSSGTYTKPNADTYYITKGNLFDMIIGPKTELRMPDHYDLIVGDTFELFYKGIIGSFSDDYFVDISTINQGANYKKKYKVTLTSAGTYTMTVSLYDSKGVLNDERTISLIARAVPSSPESEKVILCVGDSLTSQGVWPAEFARRLTASDGTPTGYGLSNITFIGKMTHDGTAYEGHGGYTYTIYNEEATRNPFYNPETGVDFAAYATECGASTIDYVYCLLGWNHASQKLTVLEGIVRTFISNIHTSFPSCKIVLVGIEIPARDGLAISYMPNLSISHYQKMIEFVHDLDDLYETIAGDTENVYHLSLAGQFDTEHNMPTTTVAVNVRNSETETIQSNGVHPAEVGGLQIADAVTRHFVKLLSE